MLKPGTDRTTLPGTDRTTVGKFLDEVLKLVFLNKFPLDN